MVAEQTMGDRIKELRLDHGLTQEDLGKLVGVEVRTVWAWEATSCVPHPGHLRKLADVLGVEPKYLRRG